MATLSTDLTHPPDLTHERRTGPQRTARPHYVDLLPPCNDACPAGEDIQGWLALAQAGRLEEAWRHLMRDDPLPAVRGRVCYHPCETSCNRAALDTAVSIHAVELPAYRLPRDVLDEEVEGGRLPPELQPLRAPGAAGYGVAVSNLIGAAIARHTRREVRVTVLGHTQRGGSPAPFDRVLSTRFGVAAVEMVARGEFGRMVARRGTELCSVPLSAVCASMKPVDPQSEIVRAARSIGISFGGSEDG